MLKCSNDLLLKHERRKLLRLEKMSSQKNRLASETLLERCAGLEQMSAQKNNNIINNNKCPTTTTTTNVQQQQQMSNNNNNKKCPTTTTTNVLASILSKCTPC